MGTCRSNPCRAVREDTFKPSVNNNKYWSVVAIDKDKTSYGEIKSYIGGYAVTDMTLTFADCVNMVEAPSIPNTVTKLISTFNGCVSLKSVKIPNSVATLLYTFHGCENLTNMTIPNSVTSIGESTFECCLNLTNVIIGNGVTNIDDYAFHKCSNLRSITFEGTMAKWNAITKGYKWNYNVPAAYVQCSDGQVPLS